jgi:hypothetical protein
VLMTEQELNGPFSCGGFELLLVNLEGMYIHCWSKLAQRNPPYCYSSGIVQNSMLCCLKYDETYRNVYEMLRNVTDLHET